MTVLDSIHEILPDEAATVALAGRMAEALNGGLVLYLEGELGTGKTTFARALLMALGVGKRVKSPTYSLLESYALGEDQHAWHLDLYRIADPGEIELLGLDEMSSADALVLIEWPERGAGWLPRADMHLHLRHAQGGRIADLHADTMRGERLLGRLPD